MHNTNTNTFPYWDDFKKEKNFQKILFRPQPVKVQTRELNQIQSIFQNQIESFANHVFKEGAMVIPGGLTINTQQLSITFELTSGSEISDIQHIEELYFENKDKKYKARIIHQEVDTSKPNTVLCVAELVETGVGEVALDDVMYFSTYDANGDSIRVAYGKIERLSKCIVGRLHSGVYYIRGMFIEVIGQSVLVDKYTNTGSYKVGFVVSENIITPKEDPTLYSQAQGTPNYKAEGAHRLKIDLVLGTFGYDEEVDNFVELAKIRNGQLQSLLSQTQYNLLEDTLAQRTYEQAGDYNVDPHQLDIREHLLVDNNGGVYRPDEGGDAAKFVAVLKPGISYVKGRRIQNIGEEYVSIEKARDTDSLRNTPVAVTMGNYLITTASKGVPVVSKTTRYRLLDQSGNQLGTALCISAEKSGEEFRVYLRDVIWTGDRTLFNKIAYEENGVKVFESTLSSNQFSQSTNNGLIFDLPVYGAKTLSNDGGSVVSYTLMQSFKVTLNGSGQGSISSGLGMSFSPEFVLYAAAKSGGEQITNLTEHLTLSGIPTGTALQINLGSGYANQDINLLALMIKSTSTVKTKTLTEVTETKVFNSKDKVDLGYTDGQTLVKVLDTNGNDITVNFSFDGGQRDEGYFNSTLQSKLGVLEDQTVVVTYTYFAHSAGDYFTVDSYSSIPYEEIPVFTSSNGTTHFLSDSIDFRPRIVNGVSDTNIVRPNSAVMMDVEYYLPRIDAVYVADNGVFSVVKGVSSNNLQAPAVPENAMRLYNLVIPPYTPNIDEVQIQTIDNRRYTMRDIGKLEKRIANVEYYTTLSALESSAISQQVFDPVTGIPRFKNGIAADPFKDFRLIDDKSIDWMGSVDFGKGLLRPFVQQNAVDMEAQNTQDGMLVCRYNPVATITQDYATTIINVNPYAVFNWEGFMKLSPNTDYWFENYYVEPRIINETVNTRGAVQEGTVYGTWKTSNTQTRNSGNWQYTTTTQVRDITTYTYTDETTTAMTGEQVVETQVIPYMREIPIRFEAEGLRPFTRMYAFFTGRDVNACCRVDGGVLGEPMVTDSNGRLYGTFYVPQRDELKFNTGDNVFRLSDSPVNSKSEDDTRTSAEIVHKSFGKRQGIQKTYVNTRVLGYSVSKTTETQTTQTQTWRDPIAQSFMVSSSRVGEFIDSVDVYFSTKAREIPITLEIREMENGLPAHGVVTRKTLNPSQVSTSTDSSVATRFKFDYPVFLQAGTEFAIVLLANTQDYNAFIAEMGKKNLLTNEYIGKQPYTGVFFMSSNGSTWTPNQTADLKFKLNSAQFEAGDNTFVLTPKAKPSERPLGVNALTCKLGSEDITVTSFGHGLVAGNKVTLSGLTGGCGLVESDLNKEFIVKEAAYSNFVITASKKADSDGVIGGENGRYLGNYLISMFYVDVTHTLIQGSSMELEYCYRDAATNLVSNWIKFESATDVFLPTEGIYREQDDFKVRVTMRRSEENNFVAPMVDTQDFTVILNSFGVDPFEKVFKYVTKDIAFNDPCSSVKFFIGARLPSQSDMELQIKLVRSGEQFNDVKWEKVDPSQPFVNDNTNFFEYEFNKDVDAKNPFVGVKARVLISGSRVAIPALKDFRLIALA